MNHVVGVVVVRDAEAILMQHRDNIPGIFYPDYWCYPGGGVNNSEDFKHAAIRELTEETGYIPKVVYKLADEIYTRSDGQQVSRHIYWTIYDNEQPIKCKEGQEMKFVKLDDIKAKKLIPGQERLFRLAIEKVKKLNLEV